MLIIQKLTKEMNSKKFLSVSYNTSCELRYELTKDRLVKKEQKRWNLKQKIEKVKKDKRDCVLNILLPRYSLTGLCAKWNDLDRNAQSVYNRRVVVKRAKREEMWRKKRNV